MFVDSSSLKNSNYFTYLCWTEFLKFDTQLLGLAAEAMKVLHNY